MKKQILAFVWFLFLLLVNTSSILAAPVINEFSSSDSSDWIEIYNSGTEASDLSLYRIRDLTANNKLDLSGSLNAGDFASFEWSNKLNKRGDLIKLILISDESIIDQVSYGDQGGIGAPEVGQSAGRKSDGGSEWTIFTLSSRNSSNNSSPTLSPPSPTPTKTPTPTKSPTPTKTPTVVKSSSGDVKATIAKTPTPTKIPIPSNQAQKTNNSAKITKEKQSSMGGALKVKEPSPKKSKEVKVLGTKDNNFSVIMVVGGLFLLIAGGSWFGLKIIKEKGLYEKIFNK